MKKQFENIDDLFLDKINNLDDSDVEINEHLIWKDIENQLDKKKKVRVLWWKYAAAACVFLLLGFAYFQYNKKEIVTTDLVTKVSVDDKENEVFSNREIIKNSIQKSDNQLFVNRKNSKVFSNNNTSFKKTLTPKTNTSNPKDLLTLEPLKSINFQKTEFAFNTTEIKPVEVALPKKLRVMHIEDFQVQPIDRINQPKTFYVFFNKEFNIDNQLPTVSITHPNNIN